MTDGLDSTARDGFMTRPGVRLTTVHSAKGLEFPVVIVTAPDQLPNPRWGDELGDSTLFYAGLTRALEHMVVTRGRPGTFTEPVHWSSKAVALADR
jgi:superfamily I DNA/RNA helicase